MDSGLPEHRLENGGFPEPPSSGPVLVVAVRHQRCGARTRVRLPAVVPASVVRRVRCAGCEADYETEGVEELGTEAPAVAAAAAAAAPEASPAGPEPSGRRLQLPGRTWRWVSVPIGAAAVIAALLLIQGGGSSTDAPGGEAGSNGATAGTGGGQSAAAGAEAPADARLVRGARFALALPAGWERANAQGGATFAAAAGGGDADATLWIEHAPNLDLDAFEARSLEQLRSLAGSAAVKERVAAPTPEGTITRLAADAPDGQPQLEVTLRAAGPYRYYLATTLQPDASRQARDGVELIHGSFIPELEGGD